MHLLPISPHLWSFSLFLLIILLPTFFMLSHYIIFPSIHNYPGSATVIFYSNPFPIHSEILLTLNFYAISHTLRIVIYFFLILEYGLLQICFLHIMQQMAERAAFPLIYSTWRHLWLAQFKERFQTFLPVLLRHFFAQSHIH